MLNEFVKRLGARKANRRTADRVRRRFPIAWVRAGELVPGQGLEISEKGVLFATKEPPPGPDVDVAIELGGRRVRARVKVVRQGPLARDGVEWVIVAGVFAGIAADDWDAIVRFCKNVGDPGNKAVAELTALASTDDDAYRLLPLRIQQRIVAALIAAGRLAPGSDAKNPLLRISYAGNARTGVHRFAVHSRRVNDGEVLQFDSSVTVDDAGSVRLEP
jgi:PilZ domain-containing protein